MKTTRDQIIDIAEKLILSKGYNGFSYADISSLLDIKNAAVHYHFPSKADLGVAVIDKINKDFIKHMHTYHDKSPTIKLRSFIEVYELNSSKKIVCFMGALGPFSTTLPVAMQKALTEAGDYLLDWLTHVLREGCEQNEFSFEETPEAKAQLLISSLLSGLILQKTLKRNIFDSIKDAVIASV
ncbi:TetR/AcrR family transcriptional regulator [Flavobacteriaceae bacterium M23B6Z8]